MRRSIRNIHVIANPASGQPESVLSTLNGVFRPAGVRFEVSITHESGDASRHAQMAAARGADLVAAYGGDGTQMEVAQGLRGTGVPMVVLPGGTANLLAVELGIPNSLAEAAQLAIDDNAQIKSVDMGRATVGDSSVHEFILRVGIGFEGLKIEKADRSMKDKYGELAYTIGGIEALRDMQVATFHLTMDGVELEAEGVNLLVTNAGNMGLKGITRWKEIDVSDGQLDVLVMTSNGLRSLAAALGDIAGSSRQSSSRPKGHARTITVVADPPQLINGDGELWGYTPVTIEVIPAAVQIVVPATG